MANSTCSCKLWHHRIRMARHALNVPLQNGPALLHQHLMANAIRTDPDRPEQLTNYQSSIWSWRTASFANAWPCRYVFAKHLWTSGHVFFSPCLWRLRSRWRAYLARHHRIMPEADRHLGLKLFVPAIVSSPASPCGVVRANYSARLISLCPAIKNSPNPSSQTSLQGTFPFPGCCSSSSISL